ncbi:hypothetical protein GCM10027422_17580 [Hymenobacter arcticus]
MRILRYTFTLCGNELDSATLVSRLSGNYTVDDPETIGSTADSWGTVSITPLVEAVVDDDYEQVNRYHAWFASFLEVNRGVLVACGANDLRIFMEVFYEKGYQCNLEVFDRETLSSLGKYHVALPISVYTLSKRALTKWAEEIKQNWRSSQI